MESRNVVDLGQSKTVPDFVVAPVNKLGSWFELFAGRFGLSTNCQTHVPLMF